MKEIEIVNLETNEILVEFKTQAELLAMIFALIEGRKKYFCLPTGEKFTIRKKYCVSIGGGGFRRTLPSKKRQKIVEGVKKNALLDKDCLQYTSSENV